MAKNKEKDTKTKLEHVEGLFCRVDNECKGKILPAGTVIFVGESRDGMSIDDVNKAIARGNVEAGMVEIETETKEENRDSDPKD